MPKYFMMNKPRGYLSACADPRCPTVLSLFKEEDNEGLFHIGRLDKDTEGLLLFTDDGGFCDLLMHPRNEIPKTYLFYAEGVLDDGKLERLCEGLSIYPKKEDFITKKASCRVLGTGVLQDYEEHLPIYDKRKLIRRRQNPVVIGEITIAEGKKHQVRRMLMAVGCKIFRLKRIRIGALTLDESLKSGEYRPLTEKEIEYFYPV